MDIPVEAGANCTRLSGETDWVKLGRYYDGGPNSTDSPCVADAECGSDVHSDLPDTDTEQVRVAVGSRGRQ